jgi:hypothetical protein
MLSSAAAQIVPFRSLVQEKPLENQDGTTVRVGDTVRHLHFDPRVTGVVLEYLYDSYVRVAWNDLSQPTTHRINSLEKTVVAATRQSGLHGQNS